jgi:hypothetical protein
MLHIMLHMGVLNTLMLTVLMLLCPVRWTLTQAQAAARASIDAVRQQWEAEQSRLRAAEQAIGLLKGEVSRCNSLLILLHMY